MSNPLPSLERRRIYEQNYLRLGLQPYQRATFREVNEGANCTGCVAHYEGPSSMRVVHATPSCPAHGGLPS